MADVIVVASEHVNNAESSDTDDTAESADAAHDYSASNSRLLLGGFDKSYDRTYSDEGGGGFTKVKTLNLSRIPNKLSLFGELEELLSFDHPRVRSECSDMISRIIPQLKHDLDTCMAMVTPQLVRNLGHQDVDVRHSAANTLTVYARHTSDIDYVFQQIIYSGLLDNSSEFSQQKRLIISSIPLLFAKDLANKDWHLLARSLLSLVTNDEVGHEEAASTLDKLKQLVGDQRFQLYTFEMNEVEKKKAGNRLNLGEPEVVFEFSFVDQMLVNILMDKSDRKLRIRAVEELKRVVKSVSYSDSLIRELPEFLVFLSELLDDSDFKVNLVTLEIYSILVDKLNWRMKKHLNRVVDDLTEHLGENKIVIRTQTSKVLRILMANLGPSPVVAAICDNLMDSSQRHSGKMKEEILNVIMVALLSYPNYEFDLRHICEAVAPTVLDPRRRVRHSALECLAVLAQSMGSSKLAVMAAAIDSAAEETHVNTEAALAAVLARLARRQLPRANDEGQLDYSLRVPSGKPNSTANNYGGITTFPRGADVDWVMAGSGTLGTPNTKLLKMTDEDVADKISSKSDQSASFPSSPAAPRRIISPGQGKNNEVAPWTHDDLNGNVRSVSITSLHSATLNSSKTGHHHHPHHGVRSSSRGSWLPPAVLPSTAAPSLSSSSWNSPVKNVQDLEDTRFVVDVERGGQGTSDVSSFGSGRGHTGGHQRLSSSDPAVRGRLLTSKPSLTAMDRGSSRPMDKVAAMLGSNILPNKIRPLVDERGKSEPIIDVKPISLPSIGQSSSSWPVNGGGTLPALPSTSNSAHSRNNNNSVLRQPPVPVKPTMVRSSSGGRKARMNSNKSLLPISNEQLDINDNDALANSNRLQNAYKSSAKHNDAELNGSLDSRQPTLSNGSDFSTEVTNRQANDNSRQIKSTSDSRTNYELNGGDEDVSISHVGRPRSRSTMANPLARPKRPRSLDLNTSLPPLEDPERSKLRRNLSSSSSGSPVWYENDRGVNNRALSEVSSLTSSLEDSFPGVINGSQSSSSLELRKQARTVENRGVKVTATQNEDDSALVRRSSSLSWELPNSKSQLRDPKHNLQRTSSLSFRSIQNQESKIEDGIKSFGGKAVHDSSTLIRSPKPMPPFALNNSNGTTISTNNAHNYNNGFKTVLPNQTTIYSYLDDTTTNAEDFNVVGRGMLPQHDSSNGTDDSPRHTVVSPPVPALQHAREDHQLPSVQGKNLAQLRHDSVSSAENEDPNSMSLSRSTFNKMMNKKMEMAQEAERRKLDRQQRLEEKRKQWLEQQEANKINKEGLQNGHIPKTPPDKPSVTRRIARQNLGASQNGNLMSSMKSLDATSRSREAEDKLLRNPEEALRTAMANLETDDWSAKCSGIRIISALCARHPNVIIDHLHNINLALINEVKNLRSTVSRSAIQCIGELFDAMKKNMEADLDNICKVLLHKSGESNVFIKEDVEKSLTHMVDNVTPQRAATALISGGANHRNAAVRKTTSQFVAAVCERLGTSKIMSGTKDVTDKILLTASQFVMDGAPMTRYYGRKIFFMLLPHPEFDRTVRQYVPTNTVRNIQDILEGLRTKGIGSMPNESMSYKSLKGSFK